MPEPSYSILEIKHLAHLLGYERGEESAEKSALGVVFIRFNQQGVLPDVVTIIATDDEARLIESEVVELFENAGNSRDFIYQELDQVRP